MTKPVSALAFVESRRKRPSTFEFCIRIHFSNDAEFPFSAEEIEKSNSTGVGVEMIDYRAGLRGGGGVGMGVSGMVFVGLVLGCIEAKFCK